MSVVSQKVGGRRRKELVSAITMEGGYAAIRRVQGGRRKEVLQVRRRVSNILFKCMLDVLQLSKRFKEIESVGILVWFLQEDTWFVLVCASCP